MDDYISKPIRIESLVEAMRKAKPQEELPQPAEEVQANRAQTNDAPVDEKKTDDVVDEKVLADLLELGGGDAGFVAEMIDSYLDTSPGLLEQIRSSHAKQDAGALRLAAHTLKSGSRDMGVAALADLFAQLEAMGQNGQLEGAGDLLVKADAIYFRAAGELSSVRDSR